MAVDTFCLGLNQHALPVRTDNIAVDAFQLCTLGRLNIKKRGNLLASLKRVLDDTLAIAGKLCISLTVGHSLDCSHRLCTECVVRNVLQY